MAHLARSPRSRQVQVSQLGCQFKGGSVNLRQNEIRAVVPGLRFTVRLLEVDQQIRGFLAGIPQSVPAVERPQRLAIALDAEKFSAAQHPGQRNGTQIRVSCQILDDQIVHDRPVGWLGQRLITRPVFALHIFAHIR
jgi:hypothetical protein